MKLLAFDCEDMNIRIALLQAIFHQSSADQG
jgi:hypothetical protein